MTKGGALKSVLVVEDADLEVNGGRYTLQQGPAIKVRGFQASDIGNRMIKGGDALPVYVLDESDIRSGGGRWRVTAGQAKQVTNVIGDARGIIQGTAIPVFPVDDNGNYDSTWPQTYVQRVIATGPIAYWILGESAGATAVDQINSPAQDGTYTGVTLGQTGIGDGNTSPFFDGANDSVDVFTAALTAAFNGTAGTALFWVIVFNAGVWTDGSSRYGLHFIVDGANQIYMKKDNTNNRVEFRYLAGGVNREVIVTPISDLNWMAWALTWDRNAGATGEAIGYINGVQQGATLINLGNWAGPLTGAAIGAFNLAPAGVWHGNLAHAIIWDSALTPAQILDLSAV